jgi:hypothetical protein
VTILAMADYPRARGQYRARSDAKEEPATPPPLRVQPRMFYHLAVPGFCAATVAGETIRCASPETQDGGYSGGAITARRWGSYTGTVEPVAVRCRCVAGQQLALRDASTYEWKRAVARVRLRLRRGLATLTEETIMKYLVDPRGPGFGQRWSYHCERNTDRGIASPIAFRRAYVKAFQEVSR